MFTREQVGAGEGGLGIGLALSRRLAEMHGGTLQVFSEGRGQGSEFRLCLPLAAPPAPARRAQQAPPIGSVPPAGVLVVDDNRDAADSLGTLLRLLGAEVRVVHSGEAALAAFDERRPSVVLLDIGMPGMNGYEVAQRMRQREGERRTRLVALTGWGQEHDRRRAAQAGFDLHLVKPADLQALHQALGSS
jgi:CheY-like chemotaxis protein